VRSGSRGPLGRIVSDSPRDLDGPGVSQGHKSSERHGLSIVPSGFGGVSWGPEAAGSVHRVSWRQVLE
jgi:hypothetical protein